jgi:hypothetical protein
MFDAAAVAMPNENGPNEDLQNARTAGLLDIFY